MPASITHMTINFQRIGAGMLDHKRVNGDKVAAKALVGLLKKATASVTKDLKKEAIEVTDEAAAQKIWDLVIATAVEAGVATSLPGTRGNEFRAQARKDEREARIGVQNEIEAIAAL